jgi:RNA polymerase sigma factor (sigma-70 family)
VNLHDLAAYSTAVARNETVSRPYLHEDAAQEGLIAGWRAMKSKVNASDAYVKKAARNGIHDAVVRQRSTGSERGSSHHLVLPHDTTALVVEGFHGPRLIIEPADEAARVDMSTAEAQPLRATVREAVKHLPEKHRKLVYLRFWGGLTAKEAARELNTTEAYIAMCWNARIRPRLAADLDHLRGVA